MMTPEKILQVGMGFWSSRTLLAAVELGLFSELAKKPATLTDLSSKLELHPRGARDFLDALVALGFLARTDGVYRNSAEADLFLDRAKPSYVGGILEMASRRLYLAWNELPAALRTGQLQDPAKLETGAANPFDSLYADTARLESFLGAMTGISHGANLVIAGKVPWKSYKSFVDVGTAQGDLAVQITLANPHLEGMGFDLPQVRPVFQKYAEGCGAGARLKFVQGDFFKEELPKADVVLMGHILHDWDLETKKMLIRKAFTALPAGGSLVVYESLIDDDRSQAAFGLLMSLNMLIETPGGFDYTGADCSGWMKEAGFRETRVEHLIGPDSMVVGVK